ncbi:MAG: hypothetical protein KF857_08140 [Fimbriimonadaceae bacterium]|nr:hypothetical protein [Fimbriimonadaceae bacterium]
MSAVAFASAQRVPDPKCLVSMGQGYVFGNPRQVAVGLASDLGPSPDGKFLAFRRVTPLDPLDAIRGKRAMARFVFSIWSMATGQVWDVLESTMAEPVMVQCAWSRASGQAVLVQTRHLPENDGESVEIVLDRLSVPTKQRQNVARYRVGADVQVSPSPDGRFVLVIGLDNGTRDDVVDMATGQRVGIPRAPDEVRFWDKVGLTMYRRGDRSQAARRYDPVSRQTVPVQVVDRPETPALDPFYLAVKRPSKTDADGDLLVAWGQIPEAEEGEDGLPVGAKPTTAADELVKAEPALRGPVVLDADPVSHTVSVAGRYVAYAKRGGVYVLPFEPVDLEWLVKAMAARARDRAMVQAKQVGLALIIYSSDYDDLLPPNSHWQDNVLPYTKSVDMLKGFSYVLDGQNLTSFDKPSETQIGSVDTRYGRAVVYADGHVKWEPSSPSSGLYLSLLGEGRRRPTG